MKIVNKKEQSLSQIKEGGGELKRKSVIIPAVILGLAVTTGVVAYTKATSAAGNGNMISNLAEKLGVEEDQVENAMDQIRDERRTERKARVSEKLDQAVLDGVITEEQKQAIIDHQVEMQQKREQERQQYQIWAEENGVDMETLKSYGVGGMGGPGGFGKGTRGSEM